MLNMHAHIFAEWFLRLQPFESADENSTFHLMACFSENYEFLHFFAAATLFKKPVFLPDQLVNSNLKTPFKR